ncbi:hypothetical protein GQ600_6246 [Phytophthora cactorum]|nr:hypothetical protein GQ600_25817 [Phytophthora cactorum]KAF1776290.1 hypothetical protein GQ600_6246 [Phytophthora cactorum]
MAIAVVKHCSPSLNERRSRIDYTLNSSKAILLVLGDQEFRLQSMTTMSSCLHGASIDDEMSGTHEELIEENGDNNVINSVPYLF